MAVSVQFEIGHTAKLKAKKTPEGFTHDWELYVRGFNKADISAYVDKVVFNLHESFQKPKRVCKEPPYVVHESGYAGFVLTVDIHFRNRDEPKRVQYPYDLDLQPHGPPYGPPHHRSEEKRFVFEKPSEEFRLKLLKGGGVPVVPAGLTGSRSHSLIAPSSFAEPTANMQQSSTSSASKHKSNSAGSVAGDNNTKKHKTRTDDTKLNTFANLFGPPDPSSKTSSAKTNADAPKNSNFNNNSSGKTLSPNATPSMTSSGASSLKDRPIKETKDKQSSNISAEKSKEKSERKEKHKSSSSASPNKDGRSEGKKSSTSLTLNAESGKSEKQRSEDKPKKEKNREKDRERSSSGAPSSNSGISKSSSSKPSTAATAASSASLLRTSTHGSVGSSSANKIEEKSVSSKSEKDTKEKHSSSSSSGKKSKKDKKEKDKDRDKDKDKEKEKREEKQRISGGSHDLKSKEERSHSSASQSYLSCSPSGQSTPNSSLTVQPQAKATTAINIVGSSSNNANNKKTEKDLKGSESLKTKSSVKSDEKTVSGAITTSAIPVGTADKKSATPNSSNSASSSTKSHKHKKKDKNKDKDKERDKEKEKERNSTGDKEKEKPKEKQKQKEKVEEKKEIEKSSEIISNKLATVATNEAKKPATTIQPVTTIASLTQQQTASTQATPPSTNANESGISKKKSQNKEKKVKDSKSSKDAKRRSEASTPTASVGCEPKSKVSKTSTPLSTAGSNIDLSDADSRQSSHENINKTITATAPVTATAPELHSDSSYSSFPDLSVKPKEKLPAISTSSNISTEKTSKTTSTVPSSKEHKREEKAKISTKNTEKTRKTEKDDKKRRRNTVQSENAFIEPPVKQAKKEQNKPAATTRESTKSPLPSRSGSVANSARPVKSLSETNLTTDAAESQLHLPAHISSNITAAATATATAMSLMPTNTNINTVAGVANHTNSNNANNVISQRNNLNVNTMHPTSPALSSNDALCPNLSELQELHHKIMTLQDNQDLQQIVEMIAASGCYEVTQRTFDFDLCKLDRGTVERLQEFFATSVS